MPNDEIELCQITCTADRDPGDISTLAASINRLGLLQPIILRETADDKFEVVDGRRRFAAIQQLGWTVLPENAFTFAAAFDDMNVIAHVANVERKNLSPAEEVRQLAALAETHSVDYLAELFGRTPGYITRRLKISTLIPDWLKVMDDPELAPLWPLDKLALIARQPECTQKKILWMKRREENFSTAAITETINEYNRQLSAAAFDIAECAKCRDNTATQELLFDDADAAGGVCLNKNCWIKKSLDKVKAILKEEKLIPIDGNAGYTEPDYKFAEKIKAKSEWEFEKVRAPKKGETANAIIVSGDEIGRRVFAVERKKTAVAAALIEKKPLTVKEQEAILKQKRNKCALKLLLDYLQKEYSAEKWMAKIPKAEQLPDLLLVLKLYGLKGKYTNDWSCKLTVSDSKDGAVVDDIRADTYKQALGQIIINLKQETECTLGQMSQYAGHGIAKLCRLEDKWPDFYTQSLIDVPEPKSLTEAKAKRKAKEK